jgi:hypothetical protein
MFALTLPAAAYAQESDPDSMPTRREFIDRPLEIPRDPFNLGVKSMAYTAGLKVAGVFDDNVRLTADDEESDFITVLLLSGELFYKREESELHLAYHGRNRIYADNDDLNGMEHFLDASGLFRLDRIRVEAGVEWRDRKDTFNPLEIPEPVDSRSARGYLRVGADFNRLDVAGTLELTHFTIDDSFHDRGDFERVGFSLMGTLRAWPQAEMFGEVLLRSTDYDENVFSDFSYIRVAVGARTAFTSTIRGEGRIGFGRTEIDDEGAIPSDDFSGVVVEALAAWDLDERHIIFAGIEYGPSESVVTGLGVHQGFHAGWRFRLEEQWAVRSSVRWGRETDADGDFERTGLEWRLGARWDSRANFYADAGVLVRAAESDDSALEYDNFRISFGMGVEW